MEAWRSNYWTTRESFSALHNLFNKLNFIFKQYKSNEIFIFLNQEFSFISTKPFKILFRDCAVLCCSFMSNSLWPYGLLCPWGFSRQEYWSGLPCPPPGDLPNPGIKPRSPMWQADSLPTEPPEKPKITGVGSLSLLQHTFPTQNRTWISCIAGVFFTSWATRGAHLETSYH